MPAIERDDSTTDNARARNPKDATDQKKLVPPPPIIGPDGKEIPRPKDAAGRPLPVYVTSEGKAILDENGRPIPLRFGEDGKPIPLDVLKGAHSKRQNQNESQEMIVVARKGPAEKVPNWVKWMGVVDIVIGIAVGLFYVYEASEAVKNKQPTLHLFITTVLLFVGVLSGGLLIIAERKNKTKLIWIWACIILLLTVIQIGVYIKAVGLQNSIVGALTYYIIRLVVALCTGCIVSTDSDSPINTQNRDNRYYTTVAGGGKRYPTRGVRTVNVGAPQTIVVQQPGYYPSYGYGYNPYYESATDAALLGFAAGSMMGGGLYGGYGWGGGWDYYDDFGYDGFGW